MGRSSAREQLLDCAEQLFAEHGPGGVSLRAINAEAGLSAAALHYHFGTKQALIEALLERRMAGPMERRRELLDAIEARGAPASARELLEVLVRPLAELMTREGEGGRRYVHLLSRLQAEGGMDRAFVVRRFGQGVARLEPLLQAALPELPASVVRLRLGLAIELLLRGLAGWETLSDQVASKDLTLDEFVGVLLDFLTGALEAPNHQNTLGSGRPLESIDATPEGARAQGENA